MKNKKLTGRLLITIISLCLFSSCTQKNNSTLSDTLGLLTSKKMEGRLYGSEGNKKTASYLSKQLADNGYEPFFNDSFEVPFQAELPFIDETSLIISTEGEDIVLEEGTDYIYSVMEPIHLQGNISENQGDSKLIIDTDSDVSLSLSVSQYRMGNYNNITGNNFSETIELGLSQEAMDIVKKHAGDTIIFQCNGEMETLTHHNVIGVLPGKNRKRAIVLGAHFDHMGQVGNLIYQGAVDNGSGVSALLDISNRLLDKTPDVDLVFAFWNIEEVGLLGSKSARIQLEEKYDEFCYINLDCLGWKDGGDIFVTTLNGSVALCQKIAALLKDAGYPIDIDLEDSMNSDHASFNDHGSINLGHSFDTLTEIHSPQDTFEKVDLETLSCFSASMATILEFSSEEILSSAKDFNETNELLEESFSEADFIEEEKYRDEILQTLAYDEYFLMPEGSIVKQIIGREGEYFDSLEKAQKLYGELNVKEKIGEYHLEQLYIQSQPIPVNKESESVGKILKRSFDANTIYSVILYYINEEQSLIYSEWFWQDAYADVKNYERNKPLEPDETWLVYTDSNIPEAYITQKGGNSVTITQGPVFKHDGLFQRFIASDDDANYTESSLLSHAKTIMNEYPLVQLNSD